MYLQRQFGRCGGEHLAAAVHAQQPPGQAAHVLVGAEDQSGAGDQSAVAERLLDGQLASALHRGIALATAFDDRGRLVGAEPGRRDVHAAARHVDVALGALRQRAGTVADGLRRPPPGVDDDVPRPPAHLLERTRVDAVAAQRLDTVDRRAAPAERGDVPAAGQAVGHHGAAEEYGPSEDQQPHGCAS